MHEQTGRQVGAVANAVLVLLLALLPFASDSTPVDHTEVRPWGCRTCPIPAQPPDGPVGEDPGLGPGEESPLVPAAGQSQPTAVWPASTTSLRAATGDLPCGESCPAVVELLASACGTCPPG